MYSILPYQSSRVKICIFESGMKSTFTWSMSKKLISGLPWHKKNQLHFLYNERHFYFLNVPIFLSRIGLTKILQQCFPISLEDFEIKNEIQMSTNNGLCSIIIYNYANLYLALYKMSSFPFSHNNKLTTFIYFSFVNTYNLL